MTRVPSPLSIVMPVIMRGETEEMKDLLQRVEQGLSSGRPRRSTISNLGGLLHQNKTVSVALDYLGMMSPEMLKYGRQDSADVVW